MNFKELFLEEKEKEYFLNLENFINKEYQEKTIYPPKEKIYEAFKYKDINEIKVIIIGQDPYFNEGQAHGLCFSVMHGVEEPKSLVNIYKELYYDLEINPPMDGNLEGWAEQGVFLLNTILTVEKGKPLSHKNKGWEIFTKRVIEELNNDNNPKVFVLWGNEARKLKTLVTNNNHLVIESSHPSPLSAYNGFFGSKPFSKINEFLKDKGLEPIDWSK